MKTLGRRCVVVGTIALVATAAKGEASAATPDLAVGQEWSAIDTPAKVVIGRIEAIGSATVVSVSLIEVPGPAGPTAIAHVPFERTALVASLDRLRATGVAPDIEFTSGYQQWKATPNGGYFTIGVAQVVALAIQSMHATPPPGTVLTP